MPKRSDTALPTYRRHKQSGQAIVTLSGHDILLGTYGTRQSRDKYNALIGEWLAAGWVRTSIKHAVAAVKRTIRRATENEVIQPATFHALQPVGGLKAGRTDANESAPTRPLPLKRDGGCSHDGSR